jgi:hypothetical protein
MGDQVPLPNKETNGITISSSIFARREDKIF